MNSGRIVNLADVPLMENGNGKTYMARAGRIAPMLGLTGLGCSLIVLPPGKRAYPFHRHHITHELFYILSGSGQVRLDGRTLPIKAGDVIANPAGKEAHQIVNNSSEELRYLAISDIGTADIIDYPDSGKVAAAAGVKDANIKTATFKALGRLTPADYFDGEEPSPS